MNRGRPRSFDPDRALDRACDVFWTRGFSAASLDELSEAMGIARPSLYAAFGDKEQLYAAATARFRAQMRALYVEALRAHPASGRDALFAFLSSAIDRYTSGDAARGCLAICTATVEAPMHPRVRATLCEIVDELDDGFTETLRRARDRGELARDADISILGKLLSATLHSIAIRARAGVSRPTLVQLARGALDVVFAPRRAKRRR
jgi:AcrR family transcriptional regulator